MEKNEIVNRLVENGRDAYNTLLAVLKREIRVAYESLSDELKKEFDIAEEKKSLEYMMQFSAVEIALYDNFFNNVELNYIKSLSHDYDFCDFLRENGYPKITWEEIYQMKESELKAILDKTEEYFYKKSLFIVFIKVLKKTGKNDAIKAIKGAIDAFLASVVVVDGDIGEIIDENEEHKLTILQRIIIVALDNK